MFYFSLDYQSITNMRRSQRVVIGNWMVIRLGLKPTEVKFQWQSCGVSSSDHLIIWSSGIWSCLISGVLCPEQTQPATHFLHTANEYRCWVKTVIQVRLSHKPRTLASLDSLLLLSQYIILGRGCDVSDIFVYVVNVFNQSPYWCHISLFVMTFYFGCTIKCLNHMTWPYDHMTWARHTHTRTRAHTHAHTRREREREKRENLHWVPLPLSPSQEGGCWGTASLTPPLDVSILPPSDRCRGCSSK